MESFIEKKTTISSDDFDEIADLLLNKTLLSTKDNTYRICEIEFYLYDDEHKDEYTHKNDDQSKYGKFYFHKYKNGTYKSGTYKGMDITLGQEDTYCGILIRSVYNIENKKMI